MASTMPQPSRPTATSPAAPVPPLPVPKTRKGLPVPSDTSRAPSPSQSPSKLRAPSSPRPTLSKSPLSNSTTNVSAPRSASSNGRPPSSPDKSLRRTISIAAFPQPPKTGSRPGTASSNMPGVSSSGSINARKGSRLSSGTTSSYRSSKTPSLLNGNGDGKSILSADARDPDASPSQSRSSSAQESYSTSATTYEDGDDTASGAAKTGSKSKESKGNVIVSVRVRPDAGGNDASRSSGEWQLEGRKGLISHRGKEAGDFYYGMYRSPRFRWRRRR